MGGLGGTSSLIVVTLGDGRPLSSREIVEETGLSRVQVYNALQRLWRGGAVLRTRVPIKESERVFRVGRGFQGI